MSSRESSTGGGSARTVDTTKTSLSSTLCCVLWSMSGVRTSRSRRPYVSRTRRR